jgi:hypothetical protein
LALSGITPIEGTDPGFVVWAARLGDLEPEVMNDPAELAERIAAHDVAALALEFGSRPAPTRSRTATIARFVDELQLRGTSVGLHGTLSAFLTAARMDDLQARFATFADLAACVHVMRDHYAMRRRCVAQRGGGVHQLRLPATPMSLAPLCHFVRDRLERGGVEAPTIFAMLRATYVGMVQILTESWEPGDADLSASVTVHDGTASVTILDRGRPRENEVIHPGLGAAVDRIHRFRIPDRHNALVLEKRLGGRQSR